MEQARYERFKALMEELMTRKKQSSELAVGNWPKALDDMRQKWGRSDPTPG
jgi:hypothetical protein